MTETQNTPTCQKCNKPLQPAHSVGPFGADPIWKCYTCLKWIPRQIGDPPPPVRCDQHAEDPHEKDESRAGIKPFECGHDREGARP